MDNSLLDDARHRWGVSGGNIQEFVAGASHVQVIAPPRANSGRDGGIGAKDADSFVFVDGIRRLRW